jgi:hypothetical protein
LADLDAVGDEKADKTRNSLLQRPQIHPWKLIFGAFTSFLNRKMRGRYGMAFYDEMVPKAYLAGDLGKIFQA